MVVVSSTFSVPAEGVLFQSPSTKLIINEEELGTATLYVTENNLVWGGGSAPGGGPSPTISLLYPTIAVHGIQREPIPALFLVLNYELRLPEMSHSGGGDTNEDDDDEEFDADDQPITQLRFVPQNENDLQAMFSALCQGQALNPEPTDEVDDEDHYMDPEEFNDAEEEFEDAEESNHSPEEAANRLTQLRLENVNGINSHQDDSNEEEIGEE